MAAAIARAMPVLPLVASIRVSPGRMAPRSWARRIIDSAGRSLTEPAGLLPSSLASTTLLVLPGMRFRRTSGVLPTKSSICAWRKVMARTRPAPALPKLSHGRLRSAGALQHPADVALDPLLDR